MFGWRRLARSRFKRIVVLGLDGLDHALTERLLAAISRVPPFDSGLQCLERKRQAPARKVNRIGFAHAPIRESHWAQNLCDDKALRKEAYVASS